MKKVHMILLTGLLCTTSLLQAKDAKVTLTSKSLKEIVVVDKSGKKVKKLVDTKKVLPGDIVVYENRVDNGKNEPVKNMVLNNPIPKEMAYLAGSAKCEKPCTILYSVDNGKVFDVPEKLKVKTADGVHVARADEYTNVRWILNQPLASHKNVMVSYKAKLR